MSIISTRQMNDDQSISIQKNVVRTIVEKEQKKRYEEYDRDKKILLGTDRCFLHLYLCLILFLSYLFIGLTIFAVLYLCMQVFYMSPHRLTGSSFSSTQRGCVNTSVLECIYASSGTCTCYSIGLSDGDGRYNTALSIIPYILAFSTPLILIWILLHIVTKCVYSAWCRRKVCEIDHPSKLLCNMMDEFEGMKIGPLLRREIDGKIDTMNISERGKRSLRRYFTSLSWSSAGATQRNTIPNDDIPSRDQAIINLIREEDVSLESSSESERGEPYEIPIDKINRYNYFRLLFGPTWNISSPYLIIRDGFRSTEYISLLNFINDQPPLKNTDYRVLYIIADNYGVIDCMAYCYLLHPELFRVSEL